TKQGLKICEIHAIWQYDTTRFDGTKGGLFAEYVNLFLKIKQESSSWPSWCVDQESKERYLAEYEQTKDIVLDPDKEVFYILPVNDETLYVNWQFREEAVIPVPYTYVVIAAYTTAHARLVLYGYLEKLGERLLYFDTDSCIFVNNENEYEPPVGNFLGPMTGELRSY
ncbi:hypothetical protein TSAR_012924, partial [Trichomalopsis sarcophagae]